MSSSSSIRTGSNLAGNVANMVDMQSIRNILFAVAAV